MFEINNIYFNPSIMSLIFLINEEILIFIRELYEIQYHKPLYYYFLHYFIYIPKLLVIKQTTSYLFSHCVTIIFHYL